MLLAGVKKWWSGSSAPEAVIAAASALAVVAPSAAQRSPPPALLWPEGRIAVSEGLWGEGFLFPGGEAEILRFARPLGLSGAASLLRHKCHCQYPTPPTLRRRSAYRSKPASRARIASSKMLPEN